MVGQCLNAALIALLSADTRRMQALRTLQALDLPDCWIGAGFVRDAVWDRLHGRRARDPQGDVDLLWHDVDADVGRDAEIEQHLRAIDSMFDWSVKNQARMHGRNDDEPYGSVENAMRHWPETATAVAVRLTAGDGWRSARPMAWRIYSSPA